MTGDPLDRIEARWRKNAELDPARSTGAISKLASHTAREAQDVLALVAVARAARDLDEVMRYRPEGQALHRALARLDGAR